MSQLVELEVDGEILVFEAAETSGQGGFRPASPGATIRKSMSEVLEPLRLYAKGISSKVLSMEPRPDEVEVKVGIKITGEAGVIFAKAGTEGSMEITLKWKPGI